MRRPEDLLVLVMSAAACSVGVSRDPAPVDAAPADLTFSVDIDTTCRDGVRDGSETDVDCGGAMCLPCNARSACERDSDCRSGTCANALCGEWPSGRDGPLMVVSGQTLTISANARRDYSSIDIERGGTLAIDEGAGWTMIGCAGDARVDGRLLATLDAPRAGVGSNIEGRYRDVAPDGQALEYTIVQSRGGRGGNGGGKTVDGNGGGGGITATGCSDATSVNGGNGAPCENRPPGAPVYGFAGAEVQGGGAGAGGGARGYHGTGIYFKILGRTLGYGVIDSSGQRGGDGGGDVGGGGGGGGAGGSGGSVVVRYGTGAGVPLWQLVVAGGPGGVALGSGGADPGQPGAAGSVDARDLCRDGLRDGAETGVDCGAACEPCR